MNASQQTDQPQTGKWAKAALAAILLLLLLLDSYAIYQVYLQRVGNALDYYPFWAGGREVVLKQQNPYDPAVMLDIQAAIYGRPALPEENQHGYAYPAYAPIVTLPFILLPFTMSAALWIALQQAMVVAAVLITVQAMHWPIGRWQMVLLCLAAMAFRYSMITFVLGQTAGWVLVSLALALWAASRGRGVLAGLALAAAAVKPQLMILPALAILVSSHPHPRKKMLLTFLGAGAILIGLSMLLAGFWIPDYVRLLQAYTGYSTTEFPILAVAQTWLPLPLSQIINWLAIAALGALLIAVLWRWRGTGKVALPVATAVIVGQLVVPQTGSYNLVLLLIPAVITLAYLNTRPLNKGWSNTAAKALVWANLTLVPWLLWPVIRGGGAIPLDVLIVPVLLLVALGSVIRHEY